MEPRWPLLLLVGGVLLVAGCPSHRHCVRSESRTGWTNKCTGYGSTGVCSSWGTVSYTYSYCREYACDAGYVSVGGKCVKDTGQNGPRVRVRRAPPLTPWQRCQKGELSRGCFRLAIQRGHLGLVQKLVTRRVVKVTEASLQLAVRAGHAPVVRYLLSKGAKASRALLAAATAGKLAMLKLLFAQGVPKSAIHARYVGGVNLLVAAIRGGAPRPVQQYLISLGARMSRGSWSMALYHAVAAKDDLWVKRCLDEGATLALCRGPRGNCLHAAAVSHSPTTLRLLLSKRIPRGYLNAVNKAGRTPLDVSRRMAVGCKPAQSQVYLMLAKSGARHRTSSPFGAGSAQAMLRWAVCANDLTLARRLVSRGAKADHVTRRRTLLYHALKLQHWDMAKLLLQHGANPKRGTKGAYGWWHFPLQPATCNLAATQLLLQHRVDPKPFKRKRMSVLPQFNHCAQKNPEVVLALLRAGAPVNARNSDRRTLLHLAMDSERTTYAYVKALLSLGADRYLAARFSERPLNTLKGSKKIAPQLKARLLRLLLDYRAPVARPDARPDARPSTPSLPRVPVRSGSRWGAFKPNPFLGWWTAHWADRRMKRSSAEFKILFRSQGSRITGTFYGVAKGWSLQGTMRPRKSYMHVGELNGIITTAQGLHLPGGISMYSNNVLAASFSQGARTYRLVGRRWPSKLRSEYYQTVYLMRKNARSARNPARLAIFERVGKLLASAGLEVATQPRAAAQKIQQATRLLSKAIYVPKKCRRCAEGEVCRLNQCVSSCYPPCGTHRVCQSGGVCSRYSRYSRSYRSRRYRRRGCMCNGHSGGLPSSGAWALALFAVLLFLWRRRGMIPG